jgi:hypothetical protein
VVDNLPLLSVADIEEDLAAVAAWTRREKTWSLPCPDVARERGVIGPAAAVPAGVADCVGLRLLRPCGVDAEQRLLTLLHLERSLHPGHDHGVLIGWGSQLVESVLVLLIAEQLRPHANSLIAALKCKAKDRRAAEALALWGEGRQPTTLGTVINILVALRRAEQLNIAGLRGVLAQRFTRSYVKLLCGPQLVTALNQVRERYRNPAAHGLRTFNAQEHEAFSRLVVAQARFHAWAQWGPDPPDPPADEAVFHHHLVGYRWADGEAHTPALSPLERLLRLQTSPASQVRVDVQVEPLVVGRTREARFAATGEELKFLLGTAISITLQAEPEAHTLLLDVGTGGSVSLLWPNRWDTQGRLEAAKAVRVPGPLCPCPLVLQGATGEERLVALAALDPWATAWRPDGDMAFRELIPGDIEQLLQEVAARDPGRWAVGRAAFRIVA